MAELLAGEIAPAERTALDQHLLDCGSCRGDFELARAAARIEWADVPVPKDVIEVTLASFREPPAAVRLLRWATAAAALVAVATLLLTSSRAPKTAPAEAARPPAERRELLATMQEPVVGALVCKDEDGRPVGELGLKSHDVTVEILDGIAKTTVEENFENHTDRRLEGTFTFPLPSDASISRLALEVNGKIEEGTCLERERAREVFESIVRRMQDPALLEWQPGGLFKCRVFPIEPRATKRVIVAYTQALPCFRGKMTYVYPLASEKTRTHPPEELRISVLARFAGTLAKVESPSHRLDVQRRNANEASMAFRAANYQPNNDFVVTLEPSEEELRVVTHRPEGEDGYFACALTPRGAAERAPGRYAFVLDASASISAPRLEVAKRLVRAMMERRVPGDRFEILAHNVEVERGGEVDLRAANNFMDRLRPIGGSDVLKALLEAPRDAELIYIGKGSPSFGEADPGKILEAVKGRRIRTIAVGSDANGLLLEKLGGMMRVSPNDDVDKRVAEIAATLGSPQLRELRVEGEGLSEIVGARDLFYGERLVVSGRYREGATKLVVTGVGYRRELEVAFPAKEEGNNYVRRLWAQRKVADLLAQGESTKPEVTALGVKYQIMTPYTSFLVLETEQMWKDHQLKREVQKQDQVLGKKAEAESGADDMAIKRDVTRKMAHLLELTYMAIDQKKYDRAMKLCDEILLIDPHYSVAKELKDGAEKSRHTDDAFGWLSGKVEQLKPLTEDDQQPVIPQSQSVRFPSREEWEAISKRLSEAVIKTEGGASPEEAGERVRLQIVEEEKVREEYKRLLDDKRERELLFGQAQMYFEREQFARAIESCDKVLKLNPNLTVVQEMKNSAQRFSHMKRNTEDLRSLTQGWKREFDSIEAAAQERRRLNVPEAWQELVAKRQPKGLSQLGEDGDGPVGSLRPEKPTVPPPTVVSPPRPVAVPAPAEAPKVRAIGGDEMRITKESAQTVFDVLTVDATVNEAWVWDGSLNGDAGKRRDEYLSVTALGKFPLVHDGRVKLELYDVQDLTYGMADFPGVDISLAQDAIGTGSIKKSIEDLPKIEKEPSRAARINDLNRQLDAANALASKVEADQQVFLRQQEVQRAQVQELTTKLDETRAKLAQSVNGKPPAMAEMQYARQLERLQQDLAELEEKHVEMARDKKSLEEKINAIAQSGGSVNVAPKKALEAKVTAVANNIGLIVISIGKDDGVLEGDEFTVYRGGDFVAKIVIDRSDRKWAAGKVVLKKGEPRVGDDVSNHIFVSGPRAGGKVLSSDGDRARMQASAATGPASEILAITRDSKFVALIRVGHGIGAEFDVQVYQGLAVGRILPGDVATPVPDVRRYLESLPAEIRQDLASRSNQQAIRAKMGLTR